MDQKMENSRNSDLTFLRETQEFYPHSSSDWDVIYNLLKESPQHLEALTDFHQFVAASSLPTSSPPNQEISHRVPNQDSDQKPIVCSTAEGGAQGTRRYYKRHKTVEEKEVSRAEQQRQASKRYRQKKKQLIEQLETRLKQLTDEIKRYAAVKGPSVGQNRVEESLQILRGLSEKQKRIASAYALCVAAAEGNLEDTRKLIEGGVDVNAGDYDDRTALHLASAEGKLEVVSLLISAGANVNVVDRWQATPLQDALRHKQYPVVRLLQEHGARITKLNELYIGALCAAAASGDLEAVKLFTELGVDVNQGDYDRRTPLHLAAAEGHFEIVNYLLSVGARVNTEDRWGDTQLAVINQVLTQTNS